MTPAEDLNWAVEQFDAAMGGSIHGYERADDMSVLDIVKALLAAGWRPPEVAGQEHFDREYARKAPQYRAAFAETMEKMTSDTLEWRDPN